MPRRGFRAPDAIPPLDHVEVHLEYALLRELRLQAARDQQLLQLAERVLVGTQEEVLGELLRNGAGAALELAALPVRLDRVAQLIVIDAVVLPVGVVLGDDDRALEVRRNARVRHPALIAAG